MTRFLSAAAAVLLCWFISPSHGGQVSPDIQNEADEDEAEYKRAQPEKTEMEKARDRWEREQERMKPTQLAPVPNRLYCRVTNMRLNGQPRPDLLTPNPRALNGHEILIKTVTAISGGRYHVTFSSILHHPTTGRETDRTSMGVNSEYLSDKGIVTWIGGLVNSPMRGTLALKDGNWVYAENQNTGEHEDMYLYATCRPR